MQMVAGALGEPAADAGGLVRPVVIHDQMDVQRPVAPVALANDVPVFTTSAAKSEVVPCRT